MEAKEIYKICKAVSLLPRTVEGRKVTKKSQTVIYNGARYYPVGLILSYDNGEPITSAVLHDLKAKSTVTAKIEKIEKG